MKFSTGPHQSTALQVDQNVGPYQKTPESRRSFCADRRRRTEDAGKGSGGEYPRRLGRPRHSSTEEAARKASVCKDQGTEGPSAKGASSRVPRLRRKIRRLHLPRSCWMVPGVDFLVYAFTGTAMPSSAHYDEACKIYSKTEASRQLQPVSNNAGCKRSRSKSVSDEMVHSSPGISFVLSLFLLLVFFIASFFCFCLSLFFCLRPCGMSAVFSKGENDESVPSRSPHEVFVHGQFRASWHGEAMLRDSRYLRSAVRGRRTPGRLSSLSSTLLRTGWHKYSHGSWIEVSNLLHVSCVGNPTIRRDGRPRWCGLSSCELVDGKRDERRHGFFVGGFSMVEFTGLGFYFQASQFQRAPDVHLRCGGAA